MGRLPTVGGIEDEVVRAALDARVDPLLDALLARHDARETLALQRALRRALPAELARGAAELARLRARAVGRFPGAAALVLTAKGVAQATSWPAAEARAAEIARLMPSGAVWDATCGIGGDAIALARAGLALVATDRRHVMALCARENLARLDLPARVAVAEALGEAVRAPFVVCDPDRREGGARALDPERWSPPFSALAARLAAFQGACVKLAPSIDARDLDNVLPSALPRRWSWVGVAGELVEAVLWTGALADASRGEREALVLDGRGGAERFSGGGEDLAPEPELAPDEAARAPYVLEPASAVVRAGLAGELGRRLGARPLGPRLGYFGAASAPPPTPLARSYRVLGSAAADRRRVRELLAAHGVGRVKVRARGHPDRTEELERRFAGSGERTGLLLVARLADAHRAYLVEPA